jgi:transposase
MEIEGGRRTFRLSEFEKGQIIALAQETTDEGDQRYTYVQIAAIIGCHRNTVSAVVRNYRENGVVQNIRPPGRPPILNAHERRIILNIIREEPLSSLRFIQQELQDSYGIVVGKDTIRRTLNQHGIQSRRSAKKAMLTHKQRRDRLDFCYRYLHMGNDFWRSIIFSDESHFPLANTRENAFIWRPQGQRFNHRYTRKFRYSEKRSVYVWGSFNYYSKGPLINIVGRLNSISYVNILRQNLLPIIEDEFEGYCLFQQDNAPPHIANNTQHFMQENDINLLDWPSNSADLNPIENLWARVKYALRRGPLRRNLPDLTESVQEIWRNIPDELIEELAESMPRRLQMCIRNRGFPIKY